MQTKNKQLFDVSIDITGGMLVEANSEDEAIELVSSMDNDELWEYIRNYGSVSIGDVVENRTNEREIA